MISGFMSFDINPRVILISNEDVILGFTIVCFKYRNPFLMRTST